jgi:hypothetical protein
MCQIENQSASDIVEDAATLTKVSQVLLTLILDSLQMKCKCRITARYPIAMSSPETLVANLMLQLGEQRCWYQHGEEQSPCRTVRCSEAMVQMGNQQCLMLVDEPEVSPNSLETSYPNTPLGVSSVHMKISGTT